MLSEVQNVSSKPVRRNSFEDSLSVHQSTHWFFSQQPSGYGPGYFQVGYATSQTYICCCLQRPEPLSADSDEASSLETRPVLCDRKFSSGILPWKHQYDTVWKLSSLHFSIKFAVFIRQNPDFQTEHTENPYRKKFSEKSKKFLLLVKCCVSVISRDSTALFGTKFGNFLHFFGENRKLSKFFAIYINSRG